MIKRLLAFLFLLAISAGFASGMPLRSENQGMQAMKCCKKSKMMHEDAPPTSLARVCCAIHCSNPTPVPSGAAANFTPAKIVVTDSILKQISLLLAKARPAPDASAFPRAAALDLPDLPPKYIQHHSFLI